MKLIVEKEREIQKFEAKKYFRVTGKFATPDGNGGSATLKADLSKRFETLEQAREFLTQCQASEFTVANVAKKPAKKTAKKTTKKAEETDAPAEA